MSGADSDSKADASAMGSASSSTTATSASGPAAAGRRKVYCVCTSNVCRSPVAEAMTRQWLDKRYPGLFTVASRGLSEDYEPVGSPASEHSVSLAAKLGLDISGHRSALMTRSEAEEATAILCVTGSHKEWLTEHIAPGPAARTHTWSLVRPVSDPWRAPMAVYQRMVDEMAEVVPATLEALDKQGVFSSAAKVGPGPGFVYEGGDGGGSGSGGGEAR